MGYVYRCECGNKWTSEQLHGETTWGQECEECGKMVLCGQARIARKMAEKDKKMRSVGCVTSLLLIMIGTNLGDGQDGVWGCITFAGIVIRYWVYRKMERARKYSKLKDFLPDEK